MDFLSFQNLGFTENSSNPEAKKPKHKHVIPLTKTRAHQKEKKGRETRSDVVFRSKLPIYVGAAKKSKLYKRVPRKVYSHLDAPQSSIPTNQDQDDNEDDNVNDDESDIEDDHDDDDDLSSYLSKDTDSDPELIKVEEYLHISTWEIVETIMIGILIESMIMTELILGILFLVASIGDGYEVLYGLIQAVVAYSMIKP